MSSSKIERALHGPSWTEVLFGAVLSAVLGVVLAAAYLIFKPVHTVAQLPKEIVPYQIYYLQGSTSRAGAWLQKRQAIVSGQSVELSEEELNTAVVTPTEKPKDGKAPAAAADAMLVPGLLNFRIAKGELQLGMPIKVTMLESTVVLQANGGFERSGDGFRYAPKSLYLGSLPVHRIPAVAGILLGRIYASQNIPEDLSAAWSKLNDATVEGKVLKLSF